MNILLPKTITTAMFGAGTNIPAVDSSTTPAEVQWVTGGTFALKDRRTLNGYWYECVQAIAGAPENTYAPGSAAAEGWWLKDEGAPTNRMAPFDKYLFTKARRAGNVTYELTPGFINGVAIYEIEADHLNITVKDGATNLITPVDIELWEQAPGLWEYLFGELARGTYYALKDIPINPNAKVTITLTRNNPVVEAAVGFISVGNWKTLLAPLTQASGVQYGVEATTRDYSYSQEYKDGTYIDVEGRKATDINLSCVIDAAGAPSAKLLLEQILGKAVAIEVSELPKYSHLATVGKVTGSVRSVNWPTAQVDLQIKGNV
ncbi:hypothetical protein [Acidovorax sp.]|uniref:hypothetical protein n=1 Tax=Acidovorax sp. TaxID=1872122 RepID=UPI0025BD0B94|nr:hypothetical protein [Acidovorax sp.]MBL7089527.1 hypothetical protein [Acidovorax sp.]